ncbi:conjugal transfer protein TraA [Salmonella enterica]|nr:conjugal transfer protein TraA [Salmonella enterica subsp. enterica serovar Typhimurium str. USDA-ARS-USMARC-1898]EBA8485156.1 conjugal transfer protein TraA [Salmonella enterica]EDE5502227.1 conjugal transfer protein TraA [Salmonella enterica subsp. enterica serovar Enteritidis]EDL7575773.1 conjugal transfer protein TraA [Salmonella enterica subsp. enterica serovar Typhimurium]TGH33987.1 conjugal transfer protein TraA [Escherichia coli]
MPVRTAVYPDMGWTLLQTYDLAYSTDIAKSSIMDRFCAER